ncbi:MAG: tetratricopeptide repeat protein [Burkholderiales bacterium]
MTVLVLGKSTRVLLRSVWLGIALLLAPAWVLAETKTDEARRLALSQMQSRDAPARVKACEVLAEVGVDKDLPHLLGALFDDDAGVRAAAELAIWRVWSRSGDGAADQLFNVGVEQMSQRNFPAAVRTFSRVIEMRPDFAEGWNKRATVYFLMGEDDLSLKDCDEVLKRNPYHFGVLSGYGQIHVRRGELARALDYFERALVINPNMDGVRIAIEAIERVMRRRDGRSI